MEAKATATGAAELHSGYRGILALVIQDRYSYFLESEKELFSGRAAAMEIPASALDVPCLCRQRLSTPTSLETMEFDGNYFSYRA